MRSDLIPQCDQPWKLSLRILKELRIVVVVDDDVQAPRQRPSHHKINASEEFGSYRIGGFRLRMSGPPHGDTNRGEPCVLDYIEIFRTERHAPRAFRGSLQGVSQIDPSRQPSNSLGRRIFRRDRDNCAHREQSKDRRQCPDHGWTVASRVIWPHRSVPCDDCA
jgi:hypothetical protein